MDKSSEILNRIKCYVLNIGHAPVPLQPASIYPAFLTQFLDNLDMFGLRNVPNLGEVQEKAVLNDSSNPFKQPCQFSRFCESCILCRKGTDQRQMESICRQYGADVDPNETAKNQIFVLFVTPNVELSFCKFSREVAMIDSIDKRKYSSRNPCNGNPIKFARIFSVSIANLFWQKTGNYLAAHTERYSSRKIKDGQLRGHCIPLGNIGCSKKDVSMQTFQLPEPFASFGWDPKAEKFYMLVGTVNKVTHLMYKIDPGRPMPLLISQLPRTRIFVLFVLQAKEEYGICLLYQAYQLAKITKHREIHKIDVL